MEKSAKAKAAPAALAAIAVAAAASLLAPSEAGALPLFARETGEACFVCHAGSKATDKIGAFVPELSVNSVDIRQAPAYVPLSALMNSAQGNYGGSVGIVNRGGAADVRNLALDGFWMRGRSLRFGAQYRLNDRPDPVPNSIGEGTWRKDSGTLFLYMRGTY